MYVCGYVHIYVCVCVCVFMSRCNRLRYNTNKKWNINYYLPEFNKSA